MSHKACIFRPENMGAPVGSHLSLGRELEVKGELSGSAPDVAMLCIEVCKMALAINMTIMF